MPPVGNKSRGGKARNNDARSRNTTPVSSTSNDQASGAGDSSSLSYDELLKDFGSLPSPPPVAQLKKIMDSLRAFSGVARIRSDTCDKGMRELSKRRRDLSESVRQRELVERQAEDERKQKELKKAKLKKEQEDAEEKPLTTGAHALAPQDGTLPDEYRTYAMGVLDEGNDRELALKISYSSGPSDNGQVEQASCEHLRTFRTQRITRRKKRSLDAKLSFPVPITDPPTLSSASSSETPAPVTEPIEEAQPPERRTSDTDASETSHQPRPEPAVPAYQTFGPDPSTFDDPTIYHIRDWTDDDDEELKKEIFGVSHYPHSNLHKYTCGTPPDRNLENAKPQNQVTANQFATYLEAFTRPLTEEDLAFLEERGDRIGPFAIPRRGLRHYKDIWAEEDSGANGDSAPTVTDTQSSVEANGSLEQMTDELAETSEISLGPMYSRLISLIRPVHYPEAIRDGQQNGTEAIDADGDVKMEGLTTTTSNTATVPQDIKPSTWFPESSLPGFKTEFPKISAQEIEDRIKAQLRNIGFIEEDAEPDFEGHFDDEIAARLRYLQGELQRVNILNGARKARVRELTEYAVAQQEWMTISDDLDQQLNQAYLKRHRNMGKGKNKAKRPGGPAGPGTAVSKPSLGDSTKAIMQRRGEWREMIGPVVDFGEARLPEEETVFPEDVMAPLIEKERADFLMAQGGGQ